MCSTVLANNIEVQYPRIAIQNNPSDLLLATDANITCKLPTPPFELGESCTNLSMKLEILNKIDTIVAATISEVVPIAITGLEKFYNDNYSSPLYWYRIKCEVKSVKKGEFPYSNLEFIATYGADQLSWQFVRGYAFYFGLQEHEGVWTINQHFRSCPLPPYNLEDHIDYFAVRRDYPDFD